VCGIQRAPDEVVEGVEGGHRIDQKGICASMTTIIGDLNWALETGRIGSMAMEQNGLRSGT